MKVFIVFLALMIVFMGFMVYGSDMNAVMSRRLHLKALAEDCAAGCCLSLDEEAYSEGLLVINRADAEELTEYLVQEAKENMPPFARGDISASVLIFDDEKGYSGREEYGIKSDIPSAVVKLVYESGDMFRLPFLELKKLERTAVYSWEGI